MKKWSQIIRVLNAPLKGTLNRSYHDKKKKEKEEDNEVSTPKASSSTLKCSGGGELGAKVAVFGEATLSDFPCSTDVTSIFYRAK